MNPGAEIFVDYQAVSTQLADAAGNARGLRRYHAAQGRVTQFFDVALEGFQHHHAFHLRNVVRRVADVMAVRLKFVVIPSRGRLDDIGKATHQLFGRIALKVIFRRAVLHIASAAGGVEKRRMRLGDADHVGAHV